MIRPAQAFLSYLNASGMKQPPLMLRLGSGTSRPGWTFRFVPSPRQVGQALSSSLKAK